MTEHRWSKFWWQDWQRDPALRMCSLAARGLWMEMLCIAYDGKPRGYVNIAGRVPTAKQLAAIVGASERDVARLIAELETAHVFSRDEAGTPFSRRMVNDQKAEEKFREFGKRGGNPSLKRRGKRDGISGRVNPPVNGRGYSQEAEAEAEAESPLPPFDLEGVGLDPKDRRPVVNGWYLDTTWERVAEAARIDRDQWRGDLSAMVGWLQSDIPLDAILAGVERVASRAGYQPPRSLAYFDAAVREQRRAA